VTAAALPIPPPRPSEPGLFVGRGRELAALRDGPRLTVVVGPPGIGKSRLLAEFAASVPDALRLEGSPRTALAWRLGCRPARVERVVNARGPTTCVLDDADALEELAALVDACPDLRVVASARVRPPAGHVLELGPLPREDAERLFSERARALDPAFIADVGPIVDRLGRHPRAIELVAGWADVLGPRQILRRLDAAPDLEGLLGDALDALPERLRRLLGALAVFESDFDAEDAAAIAGPTAGIARGLDALRRRSLIRALDRGGDRRFVVPEPIRGAARDPGAFERHGRHLVALARANEDTLRDRDGAELERRLLALAPDLLAAMDRALDRDDPTLALAAALALHPVLRREGLTDRIEAGLGAALARADDAAPDALARAHQALAVVANERGRTDDGIAALERAQALATDPQLRASLHNNLGLARWMRGDLAPARAEYDAGLALRPASALAGKLHGNRALVFAHEGAIAEAEADLDEALRHHRAAGNLRSEAIVLQQRASFLITAGRPERACASAVRAVRLLRAHDDARLTGCALAVLALAHQQRGRLAEAARHATGALEHHRRTGDVHYEAVARGVLAELAREGGDLAEAAVGYAEARELSREAGDRWCEAIWLTGLAVTHARLSDHDAAARELAEAEAIAPTFDARPLQASVELARAEVGLLGGAVDAEAARACLRDVEARFDDTRRPAYLRLALRSLREALPDAPQGPVVEVGEALEWVRVGDAETSLARRPLLRRLLGRLVGAHEELPGLAVSADALREAGWPGDRARPESAANRLYVAIATLRKLGLADVLQTAEGGYRLDPACAVRRAKV